MSAKAYGELTAVCNNLVRGQVPISTGIGFLNHMLDQLDSHAQISVALSVDDEKGHNRNADQSQADLLCGVGAAVGRGLLPLLNEFVTPTETSSTFACPLDEALTICVLQKKQGEKIKEGTLEMYSLPPYGIFPKGRGRSHIGRLETKAIVNFWQGLAATSGLNIRLQKVRGENAHHIVESSFKAFSRALRNLLDGVDCVATSDDMSGTTKSANLEHLYGAMSSNVKRGVGRTGTVTRKTRETSISCLLEFDAAPHTIKIATGVVTLDHLVQELAAEAKFSLTVECDGDIWIDEHHTCEDVAIALGQVLVEALGTKAGLTRMWCATHTVGDATVRVTMDLSNRPCLTHNLQLDAYEKVGDDLSTEMFVHVLESLVVNARMTVHICQLSSATTTADGIKDVVTATARSFGQALRYCAAVDQRRAGATASSKGTLSV